MVIVKCYNESKKACEVLKIICSLKKMHKRLSTLNIVGASLMQEKCLPMSAQMLFK